MNTTPRVLTFEKHTPGKILRCQLRLHGDGSAYLIGDEMEIVFEESPESWRKAFERVLSCGYVEVKSAKGSSDC